MNYLQSPGNDWLRRMFSHGNKHTNLKIICNEILSRNATHIALQDHENSAESIRLSFCTCSCLSNFHLDKCQT